MITRILVTGSREWHNRAAIVNALADLLEADRAGLPQADRVQPFPEITLVHGACPHGADRLADQIARLWGMQVERHPARWNDLGKRAGFIRNAEMVRLGADVCLAFIGPCVDPRCAGVPEHGSHGATHTAHLAEQAGIETRRYES